MKLVKVSENKIVEAENGYRWDYKPGYENEIEKVATLLVFEHSILLTGDEAEVMWAWLLRNLAE